MTNITVISRFKKLTYIFVVQEYAQIKNNMCSLKIGDGVIVLENPDDSNEVNSTEIIWTNETGWQTAATRWTSFYKTVPPTRVAYIKDFRVGIVHAMTSLKHISGLGNYFIKY